MKPPTSGFRASRLVSAWLEPKSAIPPANRPIE
jgi:hypothetical protein